MFDNLAPEVKPADVGSENQPESCVHCRGDVYPTGTDAKWIGGRIFCDEDCQKFYAEEKFAQAVRNDEQMDEPVERFVQEELVE